MTKIETFLIRNELPFTIAGTGLMIASYFVEGGTARLLANLAMLLVILGATTFFRRKWPGRLMLAILGLMLLPQAILLPSKIAACNAGSIHAILSMAITLVTVACLVAIMHRGRRSPMVSAG